MLVQLCTYANESDKSAAPVKTGALQTAKERSGCTVVANYNHRYGSIIRLHVGTCDLVCHCRYAMGFLHTVMLCDIIHWLIRTAAGT